jgi:thioredoxin 2
MSTLKADDRGVIASCPSCGKGNRLLYDRLGLGAQCGSCHAALGALSKPVVAPSLAVFDTLVKLSRLPVLVDFWAEWCGPCRMVAPEIKKVAERQAGQLLVVKVDTEALPDLAARLGIMSIPTLAVFVRGREAARTSGAMPASQIEALVQQAT